MSLHLEPRRRVSARQARPPALVSHTSDQRMRAPRCLRAFSLVAGVLGSGALAGATRCAARPTGAAAAAVGPPWASLDYSAIASLPAVAEQARLAKLSAVDAVSALCSGHLTAVTYATALLHRIAEFECLNAWAALNPGRVLRDAAAVDALRAGGASTAPLCGLPVVRAAFFFFFFRRGAFPNFG